MAIKPTTSAATAQEPMLSGPAICAAFMGPKSQPEPMVELRPANSRPMTPASLRNLPWAKGFSSGGGGERLTEDLWPRKREAAQAQEAQDEEHRRHREARKESYPDHLRAEMQRDTEGPGERKTHEPVRHHGDGHGDASVLVAAQCSHGAHLQSVRELHDGAHVEQAHRDLRHGLVVGVHGYDLARQEG